MGCEILQRPTQAVEVSRVLCFKFNTEFPPGSLILSFHDGTASAPEPVNMWHWDTWLLTVSFFSLIPWGPLKLWTNQTFHYPSCLLEALFNSGTELIQKDLARDMGSWPLKLVYMSKLKKVLCGLEKLHYWYRHSLMTYFWAMRISIFLCK